MESLQKLEKLSIPKVIIFTSEE